MMKKLLSLVLGLLMLPLLTEASSSSQVITLSPWWNVMSTPAVLSSLEFSNGWEWISFSTLKEWSWVSVAATTNNIKPLDGFLVYNSNNNDVSLTLNFKESASPSDKIFQKDLELWWNLVWITTTQDPLKTISPVMEIDVTNHLTNKVNSDYSNTINPELWEAYFVFIDKKDTIYGWVVEQIITNIQTYEDEQDGWNSEIENNNTEVKILPISINTWVKLVLDWKFNLLAKFKIRTAKMIEWWKLNSMILKSNTNDNPKDKSKLRIFVWSQEINNDNISINSSWDIIIKWANIDINLTNVEVEFEYWDHLWNCTTNYTLTEVNWQNFDLKFIQKFMWMYAYSWRWTDMWDWTTKFDFSVSHNENINSLSWVVMFAWNNILNTPEDFIDTAHSITINNLDQEQIVDWIWYWCPINLTNINDCNDKILKSDFKYLFESWEWIDLKVFNS